jgi:hypothetical protein
MAGCPAKKITIFLPRRPNASAVSLESCGKLRAALGYTTRPFWEFFLCFFYLECGTRNASDSGVVFRLKTFLTYHKYITINSKKY